MCGNKSAAGYAFCLPYFVPPSTPVQFAAHATSCCCCCCCSSLPFAVLCFAVLLVCICTFHLQNDWNLCLQIRFPSTPHCLSACPVAVAHFHCHLAWHSRPLRLSLPLLRAAVEHALSSACSYYCYSMLLAILLYTCVCVCVCLCFCVSCLTICAHLSLPSVGFFGVSAAAGHCAQRNVAFLIRHLVSFCVPLNRFKLPALPYAEPHRHRHWYRSWHRLWPGESQSESVSATAFRHSDCMREPGHTQPK